MTIKLAPNEIKMFAKATEIQVAWTPQTFDVFVYGGKIDVFIGCDHYKTYAKFASASGRTFVLPNEIMYITWVPSQEQMQHIVSGVDFFKVSLIEQFYHFAENHIGEFYSDRTRVLSFVMEYKFNKFWNGNDWETIE